MIKQYDYCMNSTKRIKLHNLTDCTFEFENLIDMQVTVNKEQKKKGLQISAHSFLHDILLTYHSFTMQWKTLYIIISKALTNFLPLLNIKDCLLCIACSFQKPHFLVYTVLPMSKKIQIKHSMYRKKAFDFERAVIKQR